jgi:phenylpropionate dioxygenase-like ring-hydroxylating dioxygenase large terminal subunit
MADLALSPKAPQATVPARPFYAPDYYEQEHKLIFQRSWWNVGRVEQIPAGNDYFVADIPTLGASLIIVRGKDDVIRAFHNSCAHRGNRLALARVGNCRGAFACKMHGWTYDTTGKLVFVDDEPGFAGLDRSSNGMVSVHCDTWAGFIFVNLAPDSAFKPLSEALAPLAEQIEQYPFADMQLSYRYIVEDKANWKTTLGVQLEAWHVNYLHDKSLLTDIAGERARSAPAILETVGNHAIFGVDANAAPPRPLPTADFMARYGVEKIWVDMQTSAASDKSEARPWRKTADYSAHYFFPGLILGLLDNNYILFRFWPTSADTTLWEIIGFTRGAAPTTAAEAVAKQYSDVIQRCILREDAWSHGSIHQALRTGVRQHLHLHSQEALIAHLLQVVDQAISEGR